VGVPRLRATPPHWQVPALLGAGWMLVYLAGAGWSLGQVVRAGRCLAALRRAASLIDGRIYEIDAPIPPMLVGLVRPIVLLPVRVRALDPQQRQLMIEHELTHLRRRDPWWRAARIALQCALWFNPAVRGLGRRMDWAQELGCDAAVLAGRGPAERKVYGQALVAQLAAQVRPADSLAMAFDGASITSRLALIRAGSGAGRRDVEFVAGALVVGVTLALAAMQPAFGSRAAAPVASVAAVVVPEAMQLPLAHPRVSSFFGVHSTFRGHPHDGIDFATPRGTPVLASADGVVVESGEGHRGEAKYGAVIALAHAGQLASFYAHLDERFVQVGEHVRRGQLIGYSGNTGRTTGPHLHYELWRAGAPVDPETVFGPLTADATASALLRRAHR
jgi:murein DD-endopeptidase MepM/ murein hydrolase activator NlpD